MQKSRLFLLLTCSCVAISSNSIAQNAPEQSSSDAIVVTAPRPSKLLDAPFAISKLNKVAIDRAGVKYIQDLVQIVPTLQIPQSESASSITARIRGIGTQGTMLA